MCNDFEEIILNIKNAKTIIISGHIGPDGDAIGAATALYSALISMGKDVTIFQEEWASIYKIIPNESMITNEEIKKDIDLFIAVDCGDFQRLEEKAKEYFKNAKKTINIDHHIDNPNYADLNFIDISSTSTCEMVYFIIKELCELNADIAASIYAGIVFDSGGFRYVKTSKRTHEVISNLYDFNVDFSKIYSKINNYMSLKKFQMIKYALPKVNIDLENKIISLVITLDDFKTTKCTSEDLEGLIGYILNIDDMEMSVVVYEKEESISKCSIRSKSIPINEVAKKFNGGGHLLASGCKIDENGNKSMELLLNELKKLV